MFLIYQPTSEDMKLYIIIKLGYRAQEPCESRGGRPGLPFLISLRFCGRKATLRQQEEEEGKDSELRSCVTVEMAVMGSPPLIVYGLCERKATQNFTDTELRRCV